MTSIEKMIEAHNTEESEHSTLPKGEEEKEEELNSTKAAHQSTSHESIKDTKERAAEQEKKELGIPPKGKEDEEIVNPNNIVYEGRGTSEKTTIKNKKLVKTNNGISSNPTP